MDGQAVAAAISITIGTITLYAVYLLARTAWRARRTAALDHAARTRQSASLRFTVWYVLACIAVAVVLPISDLAKVVIGVMAVAGSLVAMAGRIDPPRRSKR